MAVSITRARACFQLVDRDLPMSGKGSARMAATEFAERKRELEVERDRVDASMSKRARRCMINEVGKHQSCMVSLFAGGSSSCTVATTQSLLGASTW